MSVFHHQLMVHSFYLWRTEGISTNQQKYFCYSRNYWHGQVVPTCRTWRILFECFKPTHSVYSNSQRVCSLTYLHWMKIDVQLHLISMCHMGAIEHKWTVSVHLFMFSWHFCCFDWMLTLSLLSLFFTYLYCTVLILLPHIVKREIVRFLPSCVLNLFCEDETFWMKWLISKINWKHIQTVSALKLIQLCFRPQHTHTHRGCRFFFPTPLIQLINNFYFSSEAVDS